MKVPTQKEVQDAHEKEHFPKKRQDALAKLRDQTEKIIAPVAPTTSPSKTPRLDAVEMDVAVQGESIASLKVEVARLGDLVLALNHKLELLTIKEKKEPSNGN